MLYLFIFIISIIFIYLGNKYETNRKISFLFYGIGLLIPCFLAAIRDYSIGTDTDVYVLNIFKAATNNNKGLIDFYFHPYSGVKELLYIVLTYISAKAFCGNIFFFFFFSELLVILPIFIAIKRMERDNPNSIMLGMAIFYLFLYNMSLNIARQSIALAFTVLAFSYLNSDKKSFFIYTMIAFLFHRTAIVIIPLFVLYIIMNSEKISDRTKKKLKITILATLVICVICLVPLITLLSNQSMFSRYFTRILNEYVRNPINFNEFNSMIYILIISIVYYNLNELKQKEKDIDYYFFLAIMSIVILQFGGIIQFADRIGLYALYPVLFLIIPQIAPKTISQMKEKKNIANIVMLSVCFFGYWIFWILIQNVHETNPFMIRW